MSKPQTFPDKITPTDPRISYQKVTLPTSNHEYTYIQASPPSPRATILLIHGWPDLSLGWRYQIPLFLTHNLRVIVPDMLGYGLSSSPSSPANYTYKSICGDLSELVRLVVGENERVIIGGHDWGGAVIYRFAMYHPSQVEGLFSICTPFSPPQREFKDAASLPNFRYQEHLRGEEVEAKIVGEQKIREFLNGMFGGRTRSGKPMFDVGKGVVFEELDGIGQSPLMTREEVDWYVQSYARNGMRGPLNWYRTGELNFEEEKVEAGEMEGWKFGVDALFVAGKRDKALPPVMSQGMEKWFGEGRLRREEVDAGHWALWERAEDVNKILGEWVEGVLEGLGKGRVRKASL